MMTTSPNPLLRANLKSLRLPTMLSEHDKLACDAAASNQTFEDYLLRLTELELAARFRPTCPTQCIKNAGFPVLGELDSYDFSALPTLNKPKILELARCEWIRQQANRVAWWVVWARAKATPAISLGLAACRETLRDRYFTAANLVNLLEEKQNEYQLDRLLGQLDHVELLICDELGHRTFSRGGAELLFQVFADRYERRSLAADQQPWPSATGARSFMVKRMTAALLDRLTHHCHIFEMNGEKLPLPRSR